MTTFSQWYIEFIQRMIEDLFNFIIGFFTGVYQFFIGNPLSYMIGFFSTSKSFNVLEWFLAIISISITLLFIGIVFVVAYRFLKRYIKFVKIETDKEQLIYHHAQLKRYTLSLIEEKNAMVTMHAHKLDHKKNNLEKQVLDDDQKQKLPIRFAYLNEIDMKYQFVKSNQLIESHNTLSLNQLTSRFVKFSASKLSLNYTLHQAAIFFASMGSSKTLMIEGPSGIGKTSMAYAAGAFFMHQAKFINIMSSSKDSHVLFDKYHEQTDSYIESDFLKYLYEASYKNDVCLVVLDDLSTSSDLSYFKKCASLINPVKHMNHFIEVSNRPMHNDPQKLVDGKLLLPQNVWLIGTKTSNISNESTHQSLHDCAYIEIKGKTENIHASQTPGVHMCYDDLNKLFEDAYQAHHISHELMNHIKSIDLYISKHFNFNFGYQMLEQMKKFVSIYVACGGKEIDGIDYVFGKKWIKTISHLFIDDKKEHINQLLDLCDTLFGKEHLLLTKKNIKMMAS